MGTALSATESGKTVSVTPDSTKNYAVPSLITANGADSPENDQ
jgi:hypothetical protein